MPLVSFTVWARSALKSSSLSPGAVAGSAVTLVPSINITSTSAEACAASLRRSRGSGAVTLKVCGVEETSPISFDQQRVGVESVVIVEEGRDSEGGYLLRLAVKQIASRGDVDTCLRVDASRLPQCRPRLPNVGDVGRHLVDQAPMVLMSMGDEQTQQIGVIAGGQPGHVRERNELVRCGIQWAPDIEHYAFLWASTSMQLPPISFAPRWIRTFT